MTSSSGPNTPATASMPLWWMRVRKITYVDPDGNEIAFGAVPR
jgi:hypothetical protein